MRVWLGVLRAAILQKPRDPGADGECVLKSLKPPLILRGESNLPSTGPYLVLANHLNGPGVWVGLAAGIIAGVIGPKSRIRAVGVTAYEDFKLWNTIPVSDDLTSRIFDRFYSVYGVIEMPRQIDGVMARSSAIRKVLTSLKRGDIVILFPEGGNVPNFQMSPLQKGVGDLLRLVARHQIRVIVTAVWPVGSSFAMSIGQPLVIDSTMSTADIEHRAGSVIAAMLPENLRGPYG